MGNVLREYLQRKVLWYGFQYSREMQKFARSSQFYKTM